jgi:molybdopterin-guanine dinucleotide biosynthesis protein
VGKTTLICRLLEVLPGWGALKTTPVHRRPCPDPATCPACRGLQGEYQVFTRPEHLKREGSDTDRYRRAGAARVAWLKTRPELIGRGVDQAVQLFEDLPGVIVEGNSFTRYLTPDRLIVLARPELDEVKPSARELIGRADVVAINVGPSTDDHRRRYWRIRLSDRHGARRIVELNACDGSNPATRALLDEIAEWSAVD